MIIAEVTMVVTTDNGSNHDEAQKILIGAGYEIEDDPALPNRFTATFTQTLDEL
jgi:hypothetical protein